MKKLLFLGGSKQQIPAIKYAKDRGYFTILCDYLTDNPGQYVADKFYCVSTTDKDAILKVAKENKIDGIVAYASDPAAPTAAYVGNIIGIPSNPYQSVEILSKKNLFRKFLKENGFNCPVAMSFSNYKNAKESLGLFRFPIMIKPIDSSGSKGVNKIESINDFEEAFYKAMNNSREKIVIIEEFIERSHKEMIGGDAFVVNGKVEYFGLLNSHRDFTVSEFVPVGTSFPSFLDKDKIERVKLEVQKVVDILNIKMGALNLELMFDNNDNLYIVEIGPRNGGNMIPDLLYLSTGVDLIGATVEAALGNFQFDLSINKNNEYYSTYVIHTEKTGVLKNITFNKEIEENIINKIMYKNNLDKIEKFDGANKALGIIFLKYNSLEEEKYKMDNMNKFINIEVI
ncbi:ATP-grasp domain-containing protein [Clostridium perfringens]|uniref:ATP-grasp domain-containing protein n=1 Tax=Clostridium perfringens TaxID=1502 RepID=UPI000705C538|nr:ATP-grasp domain-containing protein [Clostridium perfringens]ALG47879.1 Phosphoribosylglycinamide synthetase, ATP-grasp (A) domain protein [Clostridium perfringens]ELC8368260.1 ATP-grasp domain-containing protein [Clostridium perfringens]ELC8420206.1 ATP-grasp domain-containing protein [Clostridium perfringens]MBO3343900.1 ATP-grasp domain-containing protein [Clostridium perfringens]MBO3347398.1 ATP-grasp domain-containing protein [Clostridium perfringens]